MKRKLWTLFLVYATASLIMVLAGDLAPAKAELGRFQTDASSTPPPAKMEQTNVAAGGNQLFFPLVGKFFGEEPTITQPSTYLLRWNKGEKVRVAPQTGALDQAGAYAPTIVPLPDGRYRMYYSGFDGTTVRILSAISNDGKSWNKEDGVRIDVWGPYQAVFAPDVVRLNNGSYRMYFSARASRPLRANIHSAISEDGLSWTLEQGVRVQHGDMDSILAQSPAVVKDANGSYFVFPDGKIRMFYAGSDGTHMRIFSAASENGLTWQKEGVRLDIGGPYALTQVTDPEIVRLPDGTYRMFYAGSTASQSPSLSAAAGPMTQQGMVSEGLGQTGLGFVIFSAASQDGLNWQREWGVRLARGTEGRPDSAQVLSPGILHTDEGDFLYYTGNNGAQSSILAAWAVSADHAPFSNIQVRRLSIAQVEVSVNYDLTNFHPVIRDRLYLGVSVLRQQNPLAIFKTPPLQAINATEPTGTAVFQIDYLGMQTLVSTAFQIMIWEQTGEICPDGIVQCSPVGFDVYNEEYFDPVVWLAGKGGVLEILDTQADPQNGPWLNARIHYNYYNVWGDPAILTLSGLFDNETVERFESSAPVVDPGESVRWVTLTYTGHRPNQITDAIRAELKTAYHTPAIVSVTTSGTRLWNPLANGSIESVQVQQRTPYLADVIIDYQYTPRAGTNVKGWLTASVLRHGRTQDVFDISHASLAPGSGQVTVTVQYTGNQLGFLSDEIDLTMKADDFILAEQSLQDGVTALTWEPAPTGGLYMLGIEEPITEGPLLLVHLRYDYSNPRAIPARIQAIVWQAENPDMTFSSDTVNVTPGTGEETLTFDFDQVPFPIATTDQLLIRMVDTYDELLDTFGPKEMVKIWHQPSRGQINSIDVEQLNEHAVRVTVDYDYLSPLQEPAWFEATLYTRFPPTPQRPFWFDQPQPLFSQVLPLPATLIPGASRSASFILKYSGGCVTPGDVVCTPWGGWQTDKLNVDMVAGRTNTHTVISQTIDHTQTWHLPPTGSMQVVEVEDVDERHINVRVDYALITDLIVNDAEIQVEVWKNRWRGALDGFTGSATIQKSDNLQEMHSVVIPVAYNGNIAALHSKLLHLTMFVNGQPVQLDGEAYAQDYVYEKTWNRDALGEIGDLRTTWISPREMALQVDYEYSESGQYTPYLALMAAGQDVSNRFDITIFPSLVVIPDAGGSGTLAIRLRYKDDYQDEFITDELEIGFLQGKEFLRQVFAYVFPSEAPTPEEQGYFVWQRLQDEDNRLPFELSNLSISRPDDQTIRPSVHFRNPSHSKPYSLQAFVWMLNLPRLPDLYREFLPPGQAEDFRDAGFVYQCQAIPPLNTGNIALDVTYSAPVGELNVSAITYVFLDNGLPVYSQTFPVSEQAQGHVIADDSLLGIRYESGITVETDTGLQDVSFLESRGELMVTVTYAKNSDVAGVEIWPEPLDPQGIHPFAPLELVGPQSVPAEQGLGIAVFRFRILDSRIYQDTYCHESLRWQISFLDSLVFAMGVPGQQPLDRMSGPEPGFEWRQAADFDRHFSIHSPYTNELEIYGLQYVIPPDGAYDPPLLLAAIPFQDGHAIPGFESSSTVHPLIVHENGCGEIELQDPLTLYYNFDEASEDSVTSDEIKFIFFASEGGEGSPIYQETIPYTHTWSRPPDTVKVKGIFESTDHTEINLTVEYAISPETQARVAAYNGKIKVWAEGLLQGERITDSSGLAVVSEKKTVQGSSGEVKLVLRISSDELVRSGLTQIEVKMSSYESTPHGDVFRRPLAHTIIDWVTRLTNPNSFIVATLEEVRILNDTDPFMAGEAMLVTMGATSKEVHETNRWPVEISTTARWYEVEDPQTISPHMPIFTQREYEMGPMLALIVGGIDDDSIPSWVGKFVAVLAKVGSIVANAFGQPELAKAIDIANEFAQKLLAYGGSPELIDTWGVVLPVVGQQWGLNAGTIDYTFGRYMDKDEGLQRSEGDLQPLITVERIIVPPDPVPVTVKLKRVVINENGDWAHGELFAYTRVFDGLLEENDLRHPTAGTEDFADGDVWTFDKVIFHTNAVGPYVYVEVGVWDHDEPDVGDDHDMLGVATWKFNVHDETANWQGEHSLRKKGRDEGDVTVYIELSSP